MNYPLISEYIEAIKSAEDNFEELSYLRPIFGEDGLPVMTSGNFAVVFKMKDEQSEKFYAVKCFTKEQEGRAEAYREIAKELKDVSSPYLTSVRYLEKELFVDTDQTTESEFPVLLMDWVEGKTLDKYLRENLDDKYALEMLAYRFSQLAQWLIPQPFAHGDLKPDNILVRENGTLVLVDYDGMYVPTMKGQKARELGSPDFRHPLRSENDFDEHIDDFPLISILLSLKTISLNPLLLEKYGTSDRLLFSVNDYRSISESIVASEIHLFLAKEDCRNIMSIFLLCFSLKILPVYFLKCLCVYFEGLNNEQYDSLSNELKEIISKAVVGDKVAQKSLGYKYFYGEELFQDYAKAIYWYRASASHGYPVALYNLGICYQQGAGANKSYFEAFKWFLLAAEKGYADAQYQVGVYYKGDMIGVRGNLSESFKWFDKAAQQGNTKAQKAIEEFDIYMRPIGKNGFHFFRKLAENGNKYGLYILGQCYWNGYGVDCDLNQALNLFKKAALKGHKKAQWEVEQWKDSWWDGNSGCYSLNKEVLKWVGKSIGEYNIIEGTKIVSSHAFSDLFDECDCSYLEKITIPSSVIEIGQNPFNCNLSEIICLSPYFEVEDRTLYSKGKERLIQCLSESETFSIPTEVKRIDDYAFYGCQSKHIIIGENVEDIGKDPFVEMEYHEEQLIVESKSPNFTVIDFCLYDKNGNILSCWRKKEILVSSEDYEITEAEMKLFLPTGKKRDVMEDSVYQCMYQEIPLDIFAESHGMTMHDIITILERFIDRGETVDIDYFIDDYYDKEQVYEIYEYFLEKGTDNLSKTQHCLKKYTEDEIRLVRIKYLSDSVSINRGYKEDLLPF